MIGEMTTEMAPFYPEDGYLSTFCCQEASQSGGHAWLFLIFKFEYIKRNKNKEISKF
jgi:hypothetical protein